MNYLHNHTDGSQLRLTDCINKTSDLIDKAVQLGAKGIAITDHETVCNCYKALKHVSNGKKKGKIPEDFVIILGNEIYLVDSIEETRDNYTSGVTKFPHFILLAKNKKGFQQIKELSSIAWTENSFKTGKMERVPTEKETLRRIIQSDPGNVIGMTACLGGELSMYILAMENADTKEEIEFYRNKIDEFISYCIDVFGTENFFLEMQPNDSEEQMLVNSTIERIANAYGLEVVVTTDSHYLEKEDAPIHAAYLNSKSDEDREVSDFYKTAYLMPEDEIRDYFSPLGYELIDRAIRNTDRIGEMIEQGDYLSHPTIVPKSKLPEFEIQGVFEPGYEQYEYINKYAHSEHPHDRYLLKLIEDGFLKKVPFNTITKDGFHEILARIDVELSELWEISLKMGDQMAAYYVTTLELINIMWDDDKGNSLVGVSRGSVTGFYICYLMDIQQMNPMRWGLPHWRHIHKSRPDFPDVDIDTEKGKRGKILESVVNYYGFNRVLNCCTFRTEGSKSAVLTACRGLGVDSDMSSYLAGMIPFERGSNWSLEDCINGNEELERKPIRQFVDECNNENPKILEVAQKISGIICGRSIHASAVFLFDTDYLDHNARMKAPNGVYTTQFDMHDSQEMSGLKMDKIKELSI